MLLVIRYLLAVVFAAAAVAKALDPLGTRASAAGLGLNPAAARISARVLPVIELALAIGMASPLYRWAAVAGCGLLVAFTITVSVALRRGRRPTCRCFGALSRRPIGAATLLRNAVLLIGSAAIATWGSSTRWPTPNLSWAVAVLGLVVVLLCITVVAIMRQQGRILQQIDDLTTRSRTPATPVEDVHANSRYPRQQPFELPDPTGMRWSLDLLNGDVGALLLFVDKHCPTCHEVLPDLISADVGTRRWVVIDQCADSAWPDLVAPHRLLIDGDGAVAKAYAVTTVPSLVVVDSDGWARSGVAAGPTAIRSRLAELDSGISVANREVRASTGSAL